MHTSKGNTRNQYQQIGPGFKLLLLGLLMCAIFACSASPSQQWIISRQPITGIEKDCGLAIAHLSMSADLTKTEIHIRSVSYKSRNWLLIVCSYAQPATENEITYRSTNVSGPIIVGNQNVVATSGSMTITNNIRIDRKSTRLNSS